MRQPEVGERPLARFRELQALRRSLPPGWGHEPRRSTGMGVLVCGYWGAMSRKNVSNVRRGDRGVDTFNVEIEAFLVFYAPDVVCYPAPGWVEDVACRGHDGIRKLSAV